MVFKTANPICAVRSYVRVNAIGRIVEFVGIRRVCDHVIKIDKRNF